MIKLSPIYPEHRDNYNSRFLENIASLKSLWRDHYVEIMKVTSLRVSADYIQAGVRARIRERVQSFR